MATSIWTLLLVVAVAHAIPREFPTNNPSQYYSPPVRSKRNDETVRTGAIPAQNQGDFVNHQQPLRKRKELSMNHFPNVVKGALEKSLKDAYMADFEALAADYVKLQEQKYGVKVLWYDLYAKRPEMEQYQQYQIDVNVENTQWQDPTMEFNHPGFTYTQYYENHGSETIESLFSKTADVPSYFTWTLTKGVNVEKHFNFSIGIPPIFDISLDIYVDLDINLGITKTETKIETYTVSHTVQIPPTKGLKAEFIVENEAMEVPWTSDVVIDGYIAIWFEEQVEGHWLWFHPVYLLANEEFQEDGESLRVDAGGNFAGTKTIDDYINLEQYDLDSLDKTNKAENRKPTLKHGP